MAEILRYIANPHFPFRYIHPQMLRNYLEQNFGSHLTLLGNSYSGQPIYVFRFGKGQVKVLAWSQMHGNEALSTHAMLDLLESLAKNPPAQKKLENAVTLDFVFMLNPDGAEKWTRQNAQDIDMNRDFHQETSSEFPLLKRLALTGNYTYALNLHEQRTIFTTNGEDPATLSFLAPSESSARDVTLTRKKAMAVIAHIYTAMRGILQNRIARYTDEFYPSSAGDNFTRLGLPCILFEGGHTVNDYYRHETRKFYTLALFEALHAMADLNGDTAGWEVYQEIFLNVESHYDLIYRNVTLNTEFPCVLDIAVQYREVIKEGESDISFVPVVAKAGDLGLRKGWKEIDCRGKRFVSATKFPTVDEEVNFTFE